MAVRDYFIHCTPGWRAAFCMLDNLVPHRRVTNPEDPEDYYTEGVRGFGWVCRMHDWAGNVGYRNDDE